MMTYRHIDISIASSALANYEYECHRISEARDLNPSWCMHL